MNTIQDVDMSIEQKWPFTLPVVAVHVDWPLSHDYLAHQHPHQDDPELYFVCITIKIGLHVKNRKTKTRSMKNWKG